MDIRILLLALGSFVIGTEMFMIAGVLPEIAASFHVSVSAAAGLAAPGKRGRALSAVIGGQTVSLIAGVPAGTWLAHAAHWTAPFWIVSAASVLAAALVRGLLPAMPPAGAAPLLDRLAPLKRPAILSALCTTLLWSVAVFSVYTYIAELYGGLGAKGETISLVLLTGGIAGFAGAALGGYAADRMGPAGTIAMALAVLAASLAAMSALHGTPGYRGAREAFLAAVALYGIGSYAFNPAQQHRLIGLSGPSAGIVLSLNASAVHLGSAGGAFLGGLVLGCGSASMLGYFGGVWALAALALSGLSLRSRAAARRGQPTGES